MTGQNYSSPSSGWAVIAQTQSTDIGPDGKVRDVMLVTFRTGNGTQATVPVPLATYSRQTVADAVNALAAQLDSAHGLTDKG